MTADRIERCTLRNREMSVTVLSLGAITQRWQFEGSGAPVDLILGYADPEAYRSDPDYLGAIVGRVANRISGARFNLAGREFRLDNNEGANTLHGGRDGLNRQQWQMDREGAKRVRLVHISSDGAAGFPCPVRFELTVSLGKNTLIYELEARPEGETPINLAQHNYYSLGTTGLNELNLQVASDRYTERDTDGIPTGAVLPVEGTTLDYRQSTSVPAETDDNFVLSGEGPQARLSAANGLVLALETTGPCLQVYAGAGLANHAPGLDGPLHPGAGVALEPQRYPDAINRPEFPSIISSPERTFRQRTILHLATGSRI